MWWYSKSRDISYQPEPRAIKLKWLTPSACFQQNQYSLQSASTQERRKAWGWVVRLGVCGVLSHVCEYKCGGSEGLGNGRRQDSHLGMVVKWETLKKGECFTAISASQTSPPPSPHPTPSFPFLYFALTFPLLDLSPSAPPPSSPLQTERKASQGFKLPFGVPPLWLYIKG